MRDFWMKRFDWIELNEVELWVAIYGGRVEGVTRARDASSRVNSRGSKKWRESMNKRQP